MLSSEESNPRLTEWNLLTNQSIKMAIRLTFALSQCLSKGKKKDEGKVAKQKVHKRIRWQLKGNQESFTFFVDPNQMDN